MHAEPLVFRDEVQLVLTDFAERRGFVNLNCTIDEIRLPLARSDMCFRKAEEHRPRCITVRKSGDQVHPSRDGVAARKGGAWYGDFPELT
jgi:hypothetical protein